MAKLKPGAWVLVADGKKALILENGGAPNAPDFSVRRKEQRDNPPDREQSANRPGRMNDGPSVHRSAMDDTDWHELEKTRFAVDIADFLYRQAHQDSYRQIVLVASPKVLGEIRERLHPEVAKRVLAEIPKVLTDQPVDAIEQRVLEDIDAAS